MFVESTASSPASLRLEQFQLHFSQALPGFGSTLCGRKPSFSREGVCEWRRQENRCKEKREREAKNSQALEDSHLESCRCSSLGWFLTHSQLWTRTYFPLINGAEKLTPRWNVFKNFITHVCDLSLQRKRRRKIKLEWDKWIIFNEFWKEWSVLPISSI